jgi:transketolase
MILPQLGSPLTDEHVAFLKAFAKSCRNSLLRMVALAQSGHPGGSLSSLDYLALLYAMRISQTNESVIVSHGHISPAVYSVLGELGVIPKEHVISHFRKADDIYEGHVNRKINGVHFGTGPLGVGGSTAAGFALGDLLNGADGMMFLMMGDGEQQEGEVYEMMNFAAKYGLGKLVNFIDYNEVQLTDSLDKTMPTNIKGFYEAAGWHVIEVNGHDFAAMWDALGQAAAESEKPSVIIGNTVMGQGVEFMEKDGREKRADWHGKPPPPEDAEAALKEMALSDEETAVLNAGLAALPNEIHTDYDLSLSRAIDTGEPRTYEAGGSFACRNAYGDALLDLAKANEHVVALTADLAGSVKTGVMGKEFPDRHIECGIAEQHMVSCSGGISLRGIVPFCSTFGAFMTSRAKDQARVNDINECNVKMVSTHCGLSVGEDGPTHQAIDDMSSFAGFYHTSIFEPADANQCDRIIRRVASEYGNCYVRMGRSKLPVITRVDGTEFFAGDYVFKPGKADVIREGSKATIVASGPMVERALAAAENLGDVEVIAVASFVPFDNETIAASAKKTGRVVTVHDHHVRTGLGSFVLRALAKEGVTVPVKTLGVTAYQLSGKPDELYENTGLTVEGIEEAVKLLLPE